MKVNSSQSPKIQETVLRQTQTEKQIFVQKPGVQQQQQQLPRATLSKKKISKSPTKSAEPTQFETGPEITWPFFRPQKCNDPSEHFWEKKQKYAVPPKEQIKFQANLLRLGKKKKTPKGYHYRLTKNGVLSYSKKESDNFVKGFLEIQHEMCAHLVEQKTKNESVLVIQFEKFQGLIVILFDTRSEQTLEFFQQLKDFCMVSGFDRLYQQLEMLGRGSFASVYKVKSIYSKDIFAAKTYFQETFDTSQHKSKFVVGQHFFIIKAAKLMIQNEIMVLRKVSHPNIIRIYEVIQEKDRLILIMEFVQGGDLYQLIKEKKKLNEKEAAILMKGCAEALNEMHKKNFVHRDLKLENIMLRQPQILDAKLVDFGFAEPINDKELVSKAGTPGYIPPEIFKLHPYLAVGDVFSLGVIFYSLISGLSCFKGKNYQAVLEENRKCEINFERSAWKDISDECKHVIKKMLERKPNHRISCIEILESEWIISQTEVAVHKSGIRQYSNSMNQALNGKQKSLYNQSDGSLNDFQVDFSYHSNDLKSFYYRNNSQKTLKTLRSNMSIKSNKHGQEMKKSKHRSASRQQFFSMKSQTMKGSTPQNRRQISQDDELRSAQQKNQNFIQKIHDSGDDASFGGNLKKDTLSQSSKKMCIAEDFDALTINNMLYLKVSYQIFNQQKKPHRDRSINEAIKKKKAQFLSLLH